MNIDKLTEEILEITNNSDYGWIDLDSSDAERIRVALTKALTIGAVSDKLILTPKDAEIFFNEIMNPKEANDALKNAMLKFITR